MPPHFYEKLPQSWFTKPDFVEITESALNIAKKFFAEVISKTPPKDWVVSFDWADDRRIRDRSSGQWQILGPGLDVAAYERQNVPKDFVARRDGFEYLVKVPDNALKAGARPVIDTDPAAPTRLILR